MNCDNHTTDDMIATFRKFYRYSGFPYAGNWELVKSIVGTTFRTIHVCLNCQAGNRVPITRSMTASG